MHPNVKRSKNVLSKNPKFDNARRICGIYFIDLKDEEVKDIMKKRSLEVSNSDVGGNAL